MHLRRVLFEIAPVGLERADAVNQHAPRDAASDRRLPIEREIKAALFTQHPEDLSEGVRTAGQGLGGRRGARLVEVGMAPDPNQLLRDGFRREDEIDRA